MATSGSFRTSAYDGFCLEFSWKQTSQNIANNTTTISWTLKGVANISGSYYKTQNITVKIDNKVVFQHLKDKNGQINLWNGTTVASGTHTITHKDDGTQTFSAYAEAGIYVWAVNCTGSANFTLDTIPRASQPSCVTWPEHTQNVGEFGDEISIHMNRKSSVMTHTVRYQFGEQSGTIATGVTTGTKWVIPLTLMNLIPNSTSGSGTIYVDTYNGSTKVGTKSCGFTATVPATVKPSCSFTLDDTTKVDEVYGSPVKGLSKIKIDVTATQAYSSPIKSCVITADGMKYTGTSVTTGILRTAGVSTVTATVTDARGRTGSVSYDMDVQDYTAPTIPLLTVRRCDPDGVENDQGECVEVVFSGEVSPMNNKNTATYSVRYKKSTSGSWTNLTEDVGGWKPSDLNNNFAVYNFSLIFAADGNSSYDVEITLEDSHNTATRTTSVSTAFTLYNCHPSGTGWRFGGVAEKEYTLQNDLDLIQRGNRYVISTPGVAEKSGFVKIVQLTHTAANADTPITFIFTRRLEASPMMVHVQFKSNSTTTDPELKGITYEGSNYGAFLVRSAPSVWELYIQKVSAYDTVTLQDWYTTSTMSNRLKITFPSTLVEGTDPKVLGTYYRATPLVSRSILDCFMPVGYILTLYSQVDPNTMYPGTTWVRMVNTFLWGCDANGDIGVTGGEKTHTLTTNEMPSHNHNVSVANTAAGSVSASNKIRYNNDSSSYVGTIASVSTGGGQAHNNMPPYTQVAIWRRTA